MTTIADLARQLTSVLVHGDGALSIAEIEYDSRHIQDGYLFVALKGGYSDGHHYLQQARERGATAALVTQGTPPDRLQGFQAVIEVPDTRAALAPISAVFYGHPSRDMTVVGATGTDGKTTTSHLIEAMCRANGRSTGMIGTVEVRIGDESELHDLRQTTPESLIVQRFLARMRAQSVDTAILEATSHGLALHRLDGCEFDIGVVTNITHEHLDFHGTVERYRAAKGMLFQKVAESAATGRTGAVVVNLDDEGARSIQRYADNCRIITYSLGAEPDAEVLAIDIIADAEGSTFTLVTRDGTSELRLHLPGRYNVANALAAAGAGVALGMTTDAIASGIASLRHVPGRMESVDEGQPFGVIVDYAHTPEAIRSVLREARRLATGRVLVLFGSAGERDIEKRGVQGAVAVQDADYAIFTSEDPRFEDPENIIADIASGAEGVGGQRSVNFECIEDRGRAVTALLNAAEPGDVVVLAGKGHERSIIYGSEKREWHEAEAARLALHDMGYRRPSDSFASRSLHT